jgi:hypothetical protein
MKHLERKNMANIKWNRREWTEGEIKHELLCT